MSRNRKRKTPWERKVKLFEANPHCHWCGRLTFLWKPIPHETTPLLAASIDHLVPRPHCGYNNGKREVVLSCHECNMSNDLIDRLENEELHTKHRNNRHAFRALQNIMLKTAIVLDIPTLMAEVED